MGKTNQYIPALRFRWLTPLYDPTLRWVMREDRFKKALIHTAGIRDGQEVLDLGCGTATLTILIKQTHPGVQITGLDGDEQVLGIGRAKAARAGVEITLDRGMSFQLPYQNRTFDRVLSSLLFHHLSTENKRRTLNEVYRVLKPGGEFHLVDFGQPRTTWARWVSLLMARLEDVSDNNKGLLPEMLRQAGFDPVVEVRYFSTIFGTLTLVRGHKGGEVLPQYEIHQAEIGYNSIHGGTA